MGWFWADSSSPGAGSLPRDHPAVPHDGASPPPSCPMHVSPETTPSSSGCPVPHSTRSTLLSASQPQPPSPTSEAPTKSTSPSRLSSLNPLNLIPSLSNAPSETQSSPLPTLRTVSSIPRGAPGDGTWEYPSPQQMYNAMLRKGKADENDLPNVESMVAIHNFLNEGAWTEILGWERRFSDGLRTGWERCKKGEARAEEEFLREAEVREKVKSYTSASGASTAHGVSGASSTTEEYEKPEPRLLRFQGRPDRPTPKSRILALLGYTFPSTFTGDPPFDRHDWYVQRYSAVRPSSNITPSSTTSTANSSASTLDKSTTALTPTSSPSEYTTTTVRYVIDYYAAPPDNGQPVFYLDVRPAIDSPRGAAERMIRFWGDVWWRGSGGVVRERERAEGRRWFV